MVEQSGNTAESTTVTEPLSQNSHKSAGGYSNGNTQMASLEQKLDVLESQLYNFLFNNLVENQNLNKFFLVPIGLPGMGKSTLSRFLSDTS